MSRSAAPRQSDSLSAAPSARRAAWRSTLGLALLGQALVWASFPPLGWFPLAWLAPIPWARLIRGDHLTGKRPYLALWFSSFVLHLAVFYWVTLPHWATSIGWIALAVYLGCYFPLFIGLSRVAVHGLRVSPLVAAPVVWTGLELARGYLLSGFGMAALAHTQYRWPEVLQLSDLAGGYGISFLIVFVGTAIERMLPLAVGRWSWWPAIPLAAVVAAVAAYGRFRMNEDAIRPGPRVALIQGSIDIDMKHDPTQTRRIYQDYLRLSRRAVDEYPDVALIVWPETMFPYVWFTFDDTFEPPADAAMSKREFESRSREAVESTVQAIGVPMLLGISTLHGATGREEPERYNSALFLDADGKARGRYDKCHLVPFGEYVPMADTFQWLYGLTPLPYGLDKGQGPQSIEIGGVRYAANICYENTIPHLIRAQVLDLRDAGHEPDVLVNLTNDGWFWGSTELDLHLACGVFRAVECRKPFLVAANTGFSAWIDSNGRIRAQGPRRAEQVVMADTELDSRGSWYLDHGDWPAAGCLAATVCLAVVGITQRRNRQKILPAQG